MADSVMVLTDLPDLILEKVFSCIDVFGRESDRLSFSLVCKKFCDIERRRTVLELDLRTNPVQALALYPKLTALKADGPTCREWAAGGFGKVHVGRHSLKILELSCSGISDLQPLFDDLSDAWALVTAPDRSNPISPATGPWGTLEELEIRSTDWLDLTCVGGNSQWKGGPGAGRMQRLTLMGYTKVGYEPILDALGPALLLLDLSKLKRGWQIDQNVFAGEFVEDKLLTQVANQCPNLMELFLGIGRSGSSFLKGLEAIAVKCARLHTIGQSPAAGGEGILPRCEWATDEALTLLASKAQSLTRLWWPGSTLLTNEGLLAMGSGLAGRLRVLGLTCTDKMEDATINSCLGALTQLEQLSIILTPGMSCEFLRGMPGLTSITIVDCTVEAARMVEMTCPKLKTMHFPWGVSIPGRYISNIFLGCPLISNLIISLIDIPEASLAGLTHLENLESLIVVTHRKDVDFDDRLLANVLRKNSRLSNLEIREAGAGLTNVGVFEAVSKSKSLESLKISWCGSITKKLIADLARATMLNSLVISLSLAADGYTPFQEADVADLRKNSICLQLMQWDSRTITCKSLPWRR